MVKKLFEVFTIIVIASLAVGCDKTGSGSYEDQKVEAPIPTPKLSKSLESDNKPLTDVDQTIEKVAKDPKEEFLSKISGVWGNLSGGCFFESYEGPDIKSGWFESDSLPNSHIISVEEISKDKYKVTVDVDPGYDEDDNEYEGYTYEAVYDGTIDGFDSCYIASMDTKDYLYMRLGNNMDDAWEYYCGSFVDDYKKLEEEHKSELRDSPTGKWYTEDYDEINNWSGSYYIELRDDGTAICMGYRNKDTGSYEIKGPGKVSITFDHCECDDPEVGGWALVKEFTYNVDMEYNGNDARISIHAPDIISNLTDGMMHKEKK